MKEAKRVFFTGACGLSLALAHFANADPVGMKTIIKQACAGGPAANLVTCNVYVQFDNPGDILGAMGFSDITTNNPGGFFQNTVFGGNTAPNPALCAVFPTLCCDSFITIGCKLASVGTTCANQPASPDGDFNSCAFNCQPQPPCSSGGDPAGCGQLVGGWFDSTYVLGIPDENLQVLVAQLTVQSLPTAQVSGTTTAFYNFGMTFPTFFDCFTPCLGCEPGNPNDAACSDGNPCTDDPCVLIGGCGMCQPPVPNSNPCNDGLFCNGADTCGGGSCSIHASDPCVGGAECNIQCNEAANHCFNLAGSPCGNPNDSGSCDDPDSCNGSGTCQANNEPNGTSCSDGNACTDPDGCQGGVCAGALLTCNDNNACTSDSCNPITGCINTPAPADDGNPCTIDYCDPLLGLVTTPVDCDDSNSCTADSCNVANGDCVNEPQCVSNAECNDGDAATSDSCAAGCCEHAGGGTGYALDIRDGKCPNKFKIGSGGDLKVYIAGDMGSDVALIDLGSIQLRLCGGSDSVSPDKPPRIKDKVTPLLTQCGDCSCHKKKKDYIDDVEIKFKKSHVSDLIDPSVPEGSLVDIEVYGTLQDGTPFAAHDCVLVDRPGSANN